MSVDYIDKIVESRDNDKMYELGCIVRDMMEYIEMEDAEEYAKIDRKMYEIVNGKILTEEKAEEIIKHMLPDGMKWTMTQTEEVRNQYGIGNVRDVDFWVVMNMAWNDYKEVFGDNVEMYAKFSEAFIKDEDAVKSKVYDYFMNIPAAAGHM